MAETVRITFDSDGGTHVRSITVTADMTSITLPDDPEKEGHTFIGWYTDEARTEKFDSGTVPKKSITLYALWEAEDIRVIFSAKLPSEPDSAYTTSTVYVKRGGSLSGVFPAVPDKEGYAGTWDTAGIDVNNITKPVTIYAKYEKKQFTYTFVFGEGFENVIKKGNLNDSFSMPVVAQRDGYEFCGWYTNTAHTQSFVYTGKFGGSNVTAYAWWLKKSELASYYKYETADGGTAVRITGLTRSASYRSELYFPSELAGLPVKYIGYSAGTNSDFATSRLNRIYISESIKSIGPYVFSSAPALSSVIFTGETSLEEIGEGAFMNCAAIEKFSLPASVTAIGAKAFSGGGLAQGVNMALAEFNVSVTGKLTSVGEKAFERCSMLSTIALPDVFTAFDYKAFTGSSLRNFIISALNPALCVFNGAVYSSDREILIYLPNTAGSDAGQGKRTYAVSEGTKELAANSFRNNANLTSVSLPSGLLSIGAYAFYGMTNLEFVTFAAGCALNSIGGYAFAGDTGIKSLALPSALINIGAYAFSDMGALENISVGSSLLGIGEGAFKNCAMLNALTIPATVSRIEAYTFYGCTRLMPVFVQTASRLREIGDYAFYGCTAINDFTVPGEVAKIGNFAFSNDAANPVKMSMRTFSMLERELAEVGESAFENCIYLTSFILPSTLERLGQRAFANCSLLQSVTFNSSISALRIIEPYTFYNCTALTNDIILPASVLEVAEFAFYGCLKMKNIYSGSVNGTPSVLKIGRSAFENCRALVPNDLTAQRLVFSSVTSIGERAFANCSAIGRLYLSEKVASVGEAAFANCTALYNVENSSESILTYMSRDMFAGCIALTTFSVPKNINMFVGNPFRGCTGLTFINVSTENTSFTSIRFTGASTYNVLYTKDLSKIVLFPSGITGSYEIPSEVSEIADYAFYGSMLTSITVSAAGNSLKIGEYAFAENSRLASVTLGARTETVGNYAFYNNPLLAAVIISDAGNSLIIGAHAFEKSVITALSVPERVASIGESAFQNCLSLQTLSFVSAGSPLSIGKKAFYGVSALTALELPARAEIIGESAFAWCIALESIKWGGGSLPLYVGARAFENCHMLANLVLPPRLAELGDYAFAYASRLISVTLDGDAPLIGEKAFLGANKIESVTVTPAITKLGDGMFYGSLSLSSVIIAAGAQGSLEIGEFTFYGCKALKEFTLSDRLSAIGKSAFESSGVERIIYSAAAGASVELGERAFAAAALKNLLIKKQITVIGKGAFAGNTGIISLAFENGYPYDIGESAFENIGDGITKFTVSVPATVTGIGKAAFKGSVSLSSVIFEAGSALAYIGEYAFAECISITSVVIPSGVTFIGAYAFYKCRTLSSAVISSLSAYTLGNFAFAECPELLRLDLNMVSLIEGSPAYGSVKIERVTVTESNPNYKVTAGVLYSKSVTVDGTYYGDGELLVCYPAGKGGSVYSVLKKTKAIADYAFSGNKYLSNIIINAGEMLGDGVSPAVVDIKQNSFSSMNSAMQIYLFNSNFTLSYETLSLAYKLHAVWQNYADNIKSTTQTHDDYIIEVIAGEEMNCRIISYIGTSTTSLNIPSVLGGLRVKEIGAGAFKDNNLLQSVYLPQRLLSVGERAFENCTSLIDIFISDSVMEIGNNCFINCVNLTKVTFDPNCILSAINRYTFYGCISLGRIDIPEKVVSIGEYAFAGTKDRPMSLSEIKFSSTSLLTSIGNNAFQYCVMLCSLNIPAKTAMLGMQVFLGCSSLTSIIIERTSIDGVVGLENDKVFNGTPPELVIYVDRVALQDYLKARYWKDIASQIGEKEKINGDYTVEDVEDTYFITVIKEYKGIYDSFTAGYDTSRQSEFMTNIPSFILNLPVASVNASAKTFRQYAQGMTADLDYHSFTVTQTNTVNISITVGQNTYVHTVIIETVRLTLNGVRVMKYLGNEEEISVPQKINGKQVLRLGSYSINSHVKKLTLPHGLLKIEASALSYAAGLYDVTVPLTLIEIGEYAFYGIRLTSFSFGTAGSALAGNSMLSVIGAYAFSGSFRQGSQPFVVPPKVTSIGAYAFAGSAGNVSGLSKITFLGSSMDLIGAYAFAYTSISTITFPARLLTLGEGAFKGCGNLLTVFIPAHTEGVTKTVVLDKNSTETFAECPYLKIYVPPLQLNYYVANWKTIGQGLEARIYASDILRTLTWGASGEYSGTFAYKVIDAQLRTAELIQYFGDSDVVIPNQIDNYNIISVATYAFNNTVKRVTFSDTLRSVNSYGFYMSTVEELVFPPSAVITEIGPYSFYGTKIVSLTIPFSLRSVMQSAFQNSALEYLYFEQPDVMNSIDTESFTIGESAFRNARLKAVYLPKRLTDIGAFSFAGNEKLEILYFVSPALIADFESNIFTVAAISPSSSLKRIGSSAFADCISLKKLYIPYLIEEIRTLAFGGCTGLVTVTMLKGRYGENDPGNVPLPVAESGIFTGVNNPLFKILVPRNSVDAYRASENWRNYAAYNSVDPDYIIGNQIDTVNGFAYTIAEGGVTLTKYFGTEKHITIPAKLTIGGITYNVRTIASYFGNETLESVTMERNPDTTQTLLRYAFAYSPNLKRVSLPSSVEIIGEYAFYKCVKLETVILPSRLRIISSNMFNSCTSLLYITIPASVTNINDGAFSGCTSLSRFIIEKQPSGNLIVEPGAGMLSGTPSYMKIFVDTNTLAAYKGKTGWTEFQSRMYTLDNLYGDYAITVNALKEITIIQYIGSATELIIPAELYGSKVTEIAANAVLPGVTKVYVPDGIKYGSDIADKVEIL